MWPKFLRNYFGFTKQQGRGLFVLLLLCIIVVVLRLFIPIIDSKPKLVLKTLPPLLPDSVNTPYNKKNSVQDERQNIQLFKFNPNTVNYEQLLQLGLSPSSAKTLIKFRNKGFVFRKKRDFIKVYGINEQDYLRLEPYIILEIDNPKNGAYDNKLMPAEPIANTSDKKTVPKIIEINSADSLALIQLNGIGPVFAKRILKYRSLLGGFTKLDQLKEVYGIDEPLYNKIHPLLRVNDELIHRLKLNSDDFKTLNRHPYISYELTKQLMNARKKRQLNEESFRSILDNETLYQKLNPYCTFD